MISKRFGLVQFFETESGVIELENIEAEPLGLDDWKLYQDTGKVKITLKGSLRNDLVYGENVSIRAGERVLVKQDLEETLKSRTIILVKGGWIPACYGLYNSNAILDINVIQEISSRFENGIRQNDRVKPDYLDFLGDPDVNCTFNISGCALESNDHSTPSKQKISDSLMRVSEKLKKALPNCIVEPAGNRSIEGIHSLAVEAQEFADKATSFLKEISHTLMSPVSKKNKSKVISQINSSAIKHGLPSNSLPVIAAFSIATSGQGANPALKIIKPSGNYSSENAYNALSDLQLISFFIIAHSHYPERNYVLLTMDKNLALFWMSLEINRFTKTSISTEAVIPLSCKALDLADDDMKLIRANFS